MNFQVTPWRKFLYENPIRIQTLGKFSALTEPKMLSSYLQGFATGTCHGPRMQSSPESIVRVNHFSIIFPSRFRSSKLSLSFKFLGTEYSMRLLFSHCMLYLDLVLKNFLFLSGLPPTILRALFISYIGTCSFHSIPLHVIILAVFGEYALLPSSLSCFIHCPITSCLFGPDILLQPQPLFPP
jgi:hypothetical protein